MVPIKHEGIIEAMRNALWISAAVKCWSEYTFIIGTIMQFVPRVINIRCFSTPWLKHNREIESFSNSDACVNGQ